LPTQDHFLDVFCYDYDAKTKNQYPVEME